MDSLEELFGSKVRSRFQEAAEDSSGYDGLGHPSPPSDIDLTWAGLARRDSSRSLVVSAG
jgi:hypothetical protein